MKRKLNKRVLYVGLPFALLSLPIIVVAFLFAMARDAFLTGVDIYDDIAAWTKRA